MTQLPNHLFIASDGTLYDCRLPDWSHKPLRANYRAGHRSIDSVADLKAVLRNGRFTDLGCYPLYFIADDGEALSFEAVRENLRTVMDSTANSSRDGWHVVACDVNYEDASLTCAHTGKRIESAYAEEESSDGIASPEQG